MIRLLTLFARTPEWYDAHRSGLNWLITPIKAGEPVPLLALSSGNQHFDVLAIIFLFLAYLLLFSGGMLLVVRPGKSRVVGVLAIALGVALAVTVHAHNQPWLEAKLINLAFVVFCIALSVTWAVRSGRAAR